MPTPPPGKERVRPLNHPVRGMVEQVRTWFRRRCLPLQPYQNDSTAQLALIRRAVGATRAASRPPRGGSKPTEIGREHGANPPPFPSLPPAPPSGPRTPHKRTPRPWCPFPGGGGGGGGPPPPPPRVGSRLT